jgi:G:T/U-mismatch repair DNA glycosylase
MRRTGWPYPRASWERRRVARELLEQHPERMSGVLRAVLLVLAQGPAASHRKLREGVRDVLGHSSDGDVDAVVELLGTCVRRTTGARGATRFELNVGALPPQLRALIGQ